MFFLFFNHRWIRRAVKGPTTRGVLGHAPPENFEILVLETPFLVFWEGKFCQKCSLNQLSFLCLFLLAWLRVEVVNFILYKLCGFWNCSGYHLQLSVLCVVSLSLKISEQLSKSEIFLSRTHIDRDSGQFSSKIGRTPTRSGWLKSLHSHTTFYGPICV